MSTTPKTADHYKVVARTREGWFTADVADNMQDAIEYRDTHGLTDVEVCVVFTDGTEQVIA
jgi:hypothetical protein